MRPSIFAAVAALACVATTAQAVPVDWNLQATVTRTNLPAFDITVGDQFSIDITLETDTAGVPVFWADSYGYYNPFDAFTLNVNGHALTLGPDLADPSGANTIGSANFPEYQTWQWHTLLYDGATPYYVETWFDFTDTNTVPIGTLPTTPPSLASARFAEVHLYSPVPNNGGHIFIAGAQVESLTTVPEPSIGALALGALGLLALSRRRFPVLTKR